MLNPLLLKNKKSCLSELSRYLWAMLKRITLNIGLLMLMPLWAFSANSSTKMLIKPGYTLPAQIWVIDKQSIDLKLKSDKNVCTVTYDASGKVSYLSAFSNGFMQCDSGQYQYHHQGANQKERDLIQKLVNTITQEIKTKLSRLNTEKKIKIENKSRSEKSRDYNNEYVTRYSNSWYIGSCRGVWGWFWCWVNGKKSYQEKRDATLASRYQAEVSTYTNGINTLNGQIATLKNKITDYKSPENKKLYQSFNKNNFKSIAYNNITFLTFSPEVAKQIGVVSELQTKAKSVVYDVLVNAQDIELSFVEQSTSDADVTLNYTFTCPFEIEHCTHLPLTGGGR
jgi:hypothetical protein